MPPRGAGQRSRRRSAADTAPYCSKANDSRIKKHRNASRSHK
jgi:hypothetical protein